MVSTSTSLPVSIAQSWPKFSSEPRRSFHSEEPFLEGVLPCSPGTT